SIVPVGPAIRGSWWGSSVSMPAAVLSVGPTGQSRDIASPTIISSLQRCLLSPILAVAAAGIRFFIDSFLAHDQVHGGLDQSQVKCEITSWKSGASNDQLA